MDITIKETGQVKSLLIPDLDGKDRTLAFVEATSGISEWEKSSDGGWTISQAEYNWWAKIAASSKNGLACLAEHKELMTDDVYKDIWLAETNEIEHFSQVYEDVFERITTGVLSAKTKGIKKDGMLRIVKDTVVTNKMSASGIHQIDCEGVFVLNTSKARYEIPICVVATYKEGSDKVNLSPALESPIHLSLNQVRVAYDVLYKAVKAELESDGFMGITDFDLMDGC